MWYIELKKKEDSSIVKVLSGSYGDNVALFTNKEEAKSCAENFMNSGQFDSYNIRLNR